MGEAGEKKKQKEFESMDDSVTFEMTLIEGALTNGRASILYYHFTKICIKK